MAELPLEEGRLNSLADSWSSKPLPLRVFLSLALIHAVVSSTLSTEGTSESMLPALLETLGITLALAFLLWRRLELGWILSLGLFLLLGFNSFQHLTAPINPEIAEGAVLAFHRERLFASVVFAILLNWPSLLRWIWAGGSRRALPPRSSG